MGPEHESSGDSQKVGRGGVRTDRVGPQDEVVGERGKQRPDQTRKSFLGQY